MSCSSTSSSPNADAIRMQESTEYFPLRDLPGTSAEEDREERSSLPPRRSDDQIPPPYARTAEPKPVPSAYLRRSESIFCLAVVYVALPLYSWVIVCIISRRPITTASYVVEAKSYNRFGDTPLRALYARNERYYRSARIIRSIVMVMTVPMISAVCARAAVIYVQDQRDAFGLHMRQVMALADRSWMDPALYLKLVSAPRGMKRYASRLLFLVMF